jgi:hypothetical protein
LFPIDDVYGFGPNGEEGSILKSAVVEPWPPINSKYTSTGVELNVLNFAIGKTNNENWFICQN